MPLSDLGTIVRILGLTHLCRKGTFVPLYLIYAFKKQMLQAADADLFNPLVPKAENSERQNEIYNFLYKLNH